MKKTIYSILFAWTLFSCDSFNKILAQGPTCDQATQLCDDPVCGVYDIVDGLPNDDLASGSSTCLITAPNATWFFLVDGQGGGSVVTIGNTPACDTDFAAWGPFDTPADALAACNGGISTANEVGCDYATYEGGDINIPSTSQVGDVYLMVITNFSDDPGIEVTVTAPPLICCPVGTGLKADIEICTGGTATSLITEFEASVGELTGSSQFIDDLGTSTSATALVVPTAADFINNTCDPIQLDLFHLYTCDSDCDGIGDAPSLAGSFVVTIYPDANNFGLTEISGSCGVASSVEITAENGDVCFTEMGNVPMDPGCDNPDDVQDLTYSFDPGFIAACNATFGNTLPASCATTFMSPSPSFTCPIGPIDFCTLAGPIDLLPMDANNVGATGTFTGTGAAYVVGNQDPGMGATLDLSSAPVGTYTLEYTLVSPGCPPITTATGCTFSLVINCNAEGGKF